MSKKSPSPLPPRVPASPRESEKEDGNPALVPRLRFPEFREVEGWKTMKLASLVQLVSGVHLSPGQYSGVGLVPYFTGPSDFTNRTQDIAKRTSDSTNLAIENDTLITVKGSGVGEIWYLTMPSVAIGRQLMALRSIDASSRFIFQFLLTQRRRFEDLAAGNLIPGLSRGDILDLESAFPSLPEQRKIASCLSSLDELMVAQGRKVAALRTHKKGLMQQLFPREGEPQPRLRFPEFKDAGGWRETTIGKICRLKAGEFVPSSDIKDEFQDGLYPCYGGNGLRGFVQSSTHDGLYVLIGRQGALCGNVNLINGRFHATEHALVVTPQEGYAPEWLLYALSDLNLNRFSIGQAQPGLSVGVLNNLPIAVPRNRDEQERIASCLSSLDDLINAQTQKLEALKTHKRGLMQQLFPSPK